MEYIVKELHLPEEEDEPNFVYSELDSGRLQAGVNPCRTSSEMQNFIKQQIFAAPCSGTMTIDQTLEEMERIRLAAGEAQ